MQLESRPTAGFEVDFVFKQTWGLSSNVSSKARYCLLRSKSEELEFVVKPFNTFQRGCVTNGFKIGIATK